jgi:exportin-1
VADSFFQQYLVRLVTDILSVLVDPDQKSGFKTQSVFLQRLIHFTMTGVSKSPIYDPASVSNPSVSNAEYLRDYISDLLKNAFPHLQPYVSHFPVILRVLLELQADNIRSVNSSLPAELRSSNPSSSCFRLTRMPTDSS